MFAFDCNRRRDYLILTIALIVFAVFIRVVPPLDRHGLNGMEIDYINWAKDLSGYEFYTNCIANHHGFLSPLLIKLWLMLPVVKNIDFHVRLLSLIFFFILLLVMSTIKLEEMDNRTKLISIFLVSINGMMILFSKNARLLPLFVLLVFLSAIFLYRNIRESRTVDALLLFIFSFLSLLNHPLSLIFLAALILSALILYGLNRTVLRSLLPLLLAFALYTPLLVQYFKFGRVEPELPPLGKGIISSWIVYLFDDIDTILFIVFLFLLFENFKDFTFRLKKMFEVNNFVRWTLLNLISGLLFFIVVSIFIPLTRRYYIIPLILFSSILLAYFLSNFKRKTLMATILVLSIKASLSFAIFDKTIFMPEFLSFGTEKELIDKLRKDEMYKSIDLSKTIFINLPTYKTRVFNFYKIPPEETYPKPNRYGYINELLYYDDIVSLSSTYNIVAILWERCEKVRVEEDRISCELNMNILKKIYGDRVKVKILKDVRNNDIKIMYFEKGS